MADTNYTLIEINQQPEVWQKVYDIVVQNQTELSKILSDFKYDNDSEAIFVGAGSSFFVGEMVAGYFMKNTGISSKAVSTTEIVTHPELYLNPAKKTLMVSFARSGNSPESVASVEMADQVCEDILHLIITCNVDGALAVDANVRNRFVLVMPEESNDKSLAMTSSVSSMALATLLFSRIDEIESLQDQVTTASSYANVIIEKYSNEIRKVASMDFDRAVFLGSGPFLGTAREGHLKLQEMTDGKVICKFDSFLAFRHGPKVVVNENTLVVYLFSNDSYVQQYELDLAIGIKNEQNPKFTIGISEDLLKENVTDLQVCMAAESNLLDEQFLAICSLVPLQLLGYYKSIDLGLHPDAPSVSGAIHRVVQGVTIYDFKKTTEYSNS